MDKISVRKQNVIGQPWTSTQVGYYAFYEGKIFKHNNFYYMAYKENESDNLYVILKQPVVGEVFKRASKDYSWINRKYNGEHEATEALKKLVAYILDIIEAEEKKQEQELKLGQSLFARLNFDKEVV